MLIVDMKTYTIRPATVSDAAVIAEHRVGMFRDMGEIPTEARHWLPKRDA
jgi:hypothetical protein